MISTCFLNSSSETSFLYGCNPLNNSSLDIFPSPFLSIWLNNLTASCAWFNWILLCTNKAITAHLNILSLRYFIRLSINLFNCLCLTLYMVTVDFVFSILNHLCSKASLAFNLFLVLTCNKPLTKSFASSDITPHGYFFKS